MRVRQVPVRQVRVRVVGMGRVGMVGMGRVGMVAMDIPPAAVIAIRREGARGVLGTPSAIVTVSVRRIMARVGALPA